MATNFDPFRQVLSLSDAVNQLMQDAVMRPGYAFSRAGEVPMNIVERQNMYYIQVAVPGVRPEDVEITHEARALTIKASRQNTLPQLNGTEKQGYLLAEFGPGEFVRTVTLPKDIDAEGIKATCELGILTITVPVAQSAQPKRIQVTTNQQEQQTIAAGQ